MLPLQRRIFLKQSAKWAIAATASFIGATTGHAAWIAEHFASGKVDDTLARLFNNKAISHTDQISLSLPEVAEDGAVVPITISSELDNIDRLYILVEKNPTPLAAEFELSSNAMVYLTARIKMAESCNVVVIARQGEQLLKLQKWVTVTHGGCGTG